MLKKLKTIGYILLAVMIAIGLFTIVSAVLIAIHLIKLILGAVLIVGVLAFIIYSIFKEFK